MILDDLRYEMVETFFLKLGTFWTDSSGTPNEIFDRGFQVLDINPAYIGLRLVGALPR